MPELTLTGDPDADRLLSDDGFALLVGMLLDQQIAMELAFVGPHRLAQRLDGGLSAETVARMDPGELEELFRQKPALHRYPGSMATRVRALATTIIEEHGGRAEQLWEQAADGRDLRRRLEALPGFGPQKARIFVALLGKQCGVEPHGWREAAGDYGQDGYRSIADVTDPESLALVRDFKRAKKAGSA